MPREILIVGNGEADGKALIETLQKEYTVVSATGGEEALSALLAASHDIAAVLVDLSLPDMDGCTFVEKVRQNSRISHVPILLTAGEREDALLVKALDAGANSFLYKPCHLGLLLAMLRSCVRQRESANAVDTLPMLLSTIMQSSSDYTFAKDIDFRYICCSPAFVRIAGLDSASETVGKTDYDLFPARMAEQFRKNDIALLTSNQPMVDFDETVYAQDGTMHYCLASKYILRDADGASIGIYGVSHDITKERGALEQLQLVNDGIPGGLATYTIKDGVLSILYCNDGFCTLFGDPRESMETRRNIDPLAWVAADDRAELMRQVHALVENNTPIDVVYRIHAVDGGYRWINQKSSTARHIGDCVQFNAILLDITDRQTAYEQLRISQEENNLAIRHGGNMICRFDVAKRSLTLSEDVARKYGVSETITDVPDEPVRLGLIAPESVDAYVAFFQAILDGSPSATAIYQQHYSSDWRWIEAKSSTVFSDEGKPVKAIISLFDVTDRIEQETIYKKWQLSMEERAPDSYTLYRCNLNRNVSFEMKDGTLIAFDMDTACGSFNDKAKAYAEQCVYHKDKERYIAFADSDAMLAGYYRGKRTDVLEYRELIPGGAAYRWLRLTVDLAEYPNSTDVEAYLMYEDIDGEKQEELQAKARTENDPLTGILNRATFKARVNESIRLSKPDAVHALLMLDIDGFKLVNDVFGHGAGDQTLIDLAAQLQKNIRRDDFAGRLGGDEFVVFLNDIPNEKIVAMKAQQICDIARKNYSVEVQTSGSVGIALYPKDGKDFESLYQNADATLYYVKGNGKNNFAFYHDDMADSNGGEAREASGEVALKKQDIKRRMLIVDDNQASCKLLTRLFEEDFRVDVVYDGASALTKIHHYGASLSVVLLDLMMPGMDGYAVLERMQRDASTKGIPVVVITGSDDRETILKVISGGASDLVTKPIDPDILRIRVNAAINKVENERLRAQNSVLSMLNDEISSYQTALEQLGMAVIVNYWIHGSYLYSPSVSTMFAGNYDNRKLWMILLSDMVATR